MYTGDMIQNLQTKLSYKSQKKVSLDKSYWIIVENTHEPLVDREVFERIQNSPARTRKTYKSRKKRLFENLIYCKECGNGLTVVLRKEKYWTVNCNKYSRDPRRKLCEPHFMPYDKLEEALLKTIKTTCKKSLESINVDNFCRGSINPKLSVYDKNDDLLSMIEVLIDEENPEDEYGFIPLCDAVFKKSADWLEADFFDRYGEKLRFYNEQGVTAKHRGHALCRLMEQLMNERRVEDFHKIILNRSYRDSLIDKVLHTQQ